MLHDDIRGGAGSRDVFDTDSDAPDLSYEPAEREMKAPLDIRAKRSGQVSALDVNFGIHLCPTFCFPPPSWYKGKT